MQPIHIGALLRALGMAASRWKRISSLITRALWQGNERPALRMKALLHTWLGAYYAVLLQKRGVDHIHVHHGYFGSWIGMVAARLLGIGFSLTLHGSDLLIHGAFLDIKLSDCRFCLTVSEYNRRYILEHFPGVVSTKLRLSRMGVVPERPPALVREGAPRRFTILSVGRLHEVKDQAFLVRACAQLRDCGLNFDCLIAGEGEERQRLASLIQQKRLQDRVSLLGHVPREEMNSLYAGADVVVLTSRSEGIPLTLMEAMAQGKIVLAPAITGIPELVVPGKNGFLYQPGNLNDFVQRILFLRALMRGASRSAANRLHWIGHAACLQVAHNFSHEKNLTAFGASFLQLLTLPTLEPSL